MITDVKAKYRSMGTWKTKIIKKLGKRSATRSTPARSYVAVPPPEGWKGGMPEQNGLRGKKG